MFNSYLITAWRNISRHMLFSTLNIVGLAVGLASSLLILHYISFELSYDSFHTKGKDIYRIREDAYEQGISLSSSATTVPALAPTLKRELPEVINATRIAHTSPFMADPVMEYHTHTFFENKIYFADDSFLDMFSFRLLKGNPKTALTQPQSIILSQSMAKKYFHKEEALGKTLVFHQGTNGKSHLVVKGVFADLPANSHFRPDFLISFTSLPQEWHLDTDWDWGNFYVYVELLPETDPKQVEAKIPSLLETYLGDYLKQASAKGFQFSTSLQPLPGIHLDSHLEGELEVNGSRKAISILALLSFLVLSIACINYINLATSQALQRAKEVGVRKVIGSSRLQLIGQFLLESLLINLLALLLALTITQLCLPFYNQLLAVPRGLSIWNNPHIVFLLVGLFLFSTLLSGLYPAFGLSAYKPVEVLKGRLQPMSTGVGLRKSLVIGQFMAASLLIVCTLTVKQQVSFMLTHDLGLNLDQILVLKGPSIKDSTYLNKVDLFKRELIRQAAIKKIAVTSSIPGSELAWARDFSRQDLLEEPDISIKIVAVDEDFFGLYQTSFLAGRGFSPGFASDKDAVVFNERAIQALGFGNAQEAIGKRVIWQENDQLQLTKTIIGVIGDFNQQSLKSRVAPLVFSLKQYTYAPWAGEYYSIKLEAKQIGETLSKVKSLWQARFAGNPFEYFFQDEKFNNQYKADKQFGVILTCFAGLAIFISCLGLIGLAAFSTMQRRKEIGIRKVLGASVTHILLMIFKDFIRLVIVGNLLAWPLAYWAMNSWLQNYAFRIDITSWLFILPSLLVVVIALLTVSIQSWKAAKANPVKNLRYE